MSVLVVLGILIVIAVALLAVWRMDRDLDRRKRGDDDDQSPPPIIDLM
jgi:hypothetical protein